MKGCVRYGKISVEMFRSSRNFSGGWFGSNFLLCKSQEKERRSDLVKKQGTQNIRSHYKFVNQDG